MYNCHVPDSCRGRYGCLSDIVDSMRNTSHFKQGETKMGDKGKKDKGKREQQKKAQRSPKEKRRLKEEKKKK